MLNILIVTSCKRKDKHANEKHIHVNVAGSAKLQAVRVR